MAEDSMILKTGRPDFFNRAQITIRGREVVDRALKIKVRREQCLDVEEIAAAVGTALVDDLARISKAEAELSLACLHLYGCDALRQIYKDGFDFVYVIRSVVDYIDTDASRVQLSAHEGHEFLRQRHITDKLSAYWSALSSMGCDDPYKLRCLDTVSRHSFEGEHEDGRFQDYVYLRKMDSDGVTYLLTQNPWSAIALLRQEDSAGWITIGDGKRYMDSMGAR